MSRTAFKLPAKLSQFYVYVLILVLLFLTSLNIKNFLTPKKVLGVNTQISETEKEDLFWQSFLDKHPSYIPGLIETGRTSEAGSVDPNFTP